MEVKIAVADMPEYETGADDRQALGVVLRGLGLQPVIAFGKHCANHAFDHDGHHVLATLVDVPEIGRWFLEVETLVPDDQPTAPALDVGWDVVTGLGLGADDEDPAFYIDLVTTGRARSHLVDLLRLSVTADFVRVTVVVAS